MLSNKTQGYKHHPQLLRFKKCKDPSLQIANYLRAIHREAMRRGYRFDKSKLLRLGRTQKISVTRAQLAFEWNHLKRKLRIRSPDSLAQLRETDRPRTHPIFRVISGPIAEWEIVHRVQKYRKRT